MQKTELANYSSILVWKRGHMVMITMGQSTAISCVLRHFRHDDNQPTKQPGDPIASLLLTSVRRQSSSIKSYSKSLDKEKGKSILWPAAHWIAIILIIVMSVCVITKILLRDRPDGPQRNLPASLQQVHRPADEDGEYLLMRV